VFNLASGQPRRIGDILATMIARASVPIRVEVDPARLRPVEIMRAVGDATKAREVLGWRPEAFMVDFKERQD
jgi:GDP-4-dehydro-6-deoxy-D-mannose reductase